MKTYWEDSQEVESDGWDASDDMKNITLYCDIFIGEWCISPILKENATLADIDNWKTLAQDWLDNYCVDKECWT